MTKSNLGFVAYPPEKLEYTFSGGYAKKPLIYRAAFNSAWSKYKDADDRQGDASREETAHRVAWAAVKQSYEKVDDKWVAKKD